MRPVEAVQWADALEVDVKDLPAVLGLEVSRMDGLGTRWPSCTRSWRRPAAGLPGDAVAVDSAWSAAQGQLMAVAADARRTA